MQVCVWEPTEGSVINTIYGHTDTVKSVAFNPNTKNVALPVLASAGDFSVRLSDPRPTQKADILSCSLHTTGKEVEAVSISPDGTLLVTGGRDGFLILMNLHVPSLNPHTDTARTTTSAATVRHSCEILERSLASRQSTSDLAEENSAAEENIGPAFESEVSEVMVDIHKASNRRSRLLEMKSGVTTAAAVNLRRGRDRRMKEKVVDIPTMIAHLSARASFIQDSSSGNSSSESDNDSDSDDLESQFQVSASEQFTKRKDSVQEIIESNERPPQSQKSNRQKSIFDDDEMDNVVLMMKHFLDDNKPSEATVHEQPMFIPPSVVRKTVEKGHPLNRASSASGNEYGDEVPLSMI